METMEETMSPKTVAPTHTKRPQKHHLLRIFIALISVVLTALVVFLGIQAATRTGFFQEPGRLILDDTLSNEQRSLVETAIQNLELTADLIVTASSSFTNNLPENSVLTDITVAVTDFYDDVFSIPSSDFTNYNLISIDELEPSQKLLALDDHYYLDDFSTGARFNYLTFSSESPSELAEAIRLTSDQIPAFPNPDNVLTLAQTGVTALSRGMNAKLRQISNASFFTENIGEFLSSFDLTHTSNESSFSSNASSENICADPKMLDVLTSIGLDIVELTGNHNQDCGDEDALDTLQTYHDLDIKTFGGGETAEIASQPLEISAKNTSVTLLGYNYSTGGYTLDDTPGANFYTEEKALADITAAKERGDFVIVDIQFFECNSYADTSENTTCDRADSSEGDQITFFRHLIDLGANIVVGTSAHQPQTFELYNNGAIYYGLGNLFFDQSWWPGTTRSLILVHYFYNNQLLQTRIIPTIFDSNYQTKLMEPDDASKFLQRLKSVRP